MLSVLGSPVRLFRRVVDAVADEATVSDQTLADASSARYAGFVVAFTESLGDSPAQESR